MHIGARTVGTQQRLGTVQRLALRMGLFVVLSQLGECTEQIPAFFACMFWRSVHGFEMVLERIILDIHLGTTLARGAWKLPHTGVYLQMLFQTMMFLETCLATWVEARIRCNILMGLSMTHKAAV